jgi:phage terminase small subunit
MLTLKESHQRFADKYFETLNGTQSAIYAGYAEASARIEASRLLDREDVQTYLQGLRAILDEKTGISQQKVLEEIAKIAFADIRNFYKGDDQLKAITDLDDNEAAALMSVKMYEEYTPDGPIGMNKEIKMYNKLDGLEKLARHLGMYEKDNRQKDQPITKLQVEIVRPKQED